MGRGGARPGSGRKPGPQGKSAIVVGMDGIRRSMLPPAVSEPERELLLTPPADLPEKVQMCWRQCAAAALGERTLTVSTMSGFRQFCQQWAYVAELDAKIQLLGVATKDAEPYLRQYIKLVQRLDSSLARFKLTAFGKPVTSEKPKAAANPWAQVAAK